MKLSLHAVGRMKNGPEKELFQRYWERAAATGKAHGFQPLFLREYSESKAARPAERMAQEAAEILKQIGERAIVIAFDERGASMTSPAFAHLFENAHEAGAAELVFLIGGADGLDPALRERADRLVSFGALTWPHQLVRILAAEQIYRVFSILSGHPYHKTGA